MASLSIGFFEAGLLYPVSQLEEGDCCYVDLYSPGVHGPAEVGCKQCDGFFGARDCC